MKVSTHNFSSGKLPHEPKEGEMLIFPAHLQHEVKMKLTESERISVSYNLNLELFSNNTGDTDDTQNSKMLSFFINIQKSKYNVKTRAQLISCRYSHICGNRC